VFADGEAVLTNKLFCRTVAVESDNFESVKARAINFGSPGSEFEGSSTSLSWTEDIAFGFQGSGWSSGVNWVDVNTRVAIVHLDSIWRDSDTEVLGIISSFSSLANSAGRYLLRERQERHITADLKAIYRSGAIQDRLVGFTGKNGSELFSVSGARGFPALRQFAGGIQAISLAIGDNTFEVDGSFNLSFHDQGLSVNVIHEEIAAIYSDAREHLSFARAQDINIEYA
jgi:hypothetical protein